MIKILIKDVINKILSESISQGLYKAPIDLEVLQNREKIRYCIIK